MTEPTRRKVLKAAAWTAPVIAVAVAAPAHAASPKCAKSIFIYDPRKSKLEKAKNDKVIIEVRQGDKVRFTFLKDIDSVDFNITVMVDGKKVNTNIHPNCGARKGDVHEHLLRKCQDPTFIQANGNNVHYNGNGNFS